jgi:hypothetical protein
MPADRKPMKSLYQAGAATKMGIMHTQSRTLRPETESIANTEPRTNTEPDVDTTPHVEIGPDLQPEPEPLQSQRQCAARKVLSHAATLPASQAVPSPEDPELEDPEPIAMYPETAAKMVSMRLDHASTNHSLQNMRAWLQNPVLLDRNGKLTRLGLVATTYLTCPKVSEANRQAIIKNNEIVVPRGSARRRGFGLVPVCSAHCC